MFGWLHYLTRRPPKRRILIYLTQDDIIAIDESIGRYEYESRGDYIPHAIRHFKRIMKEFENIETRKENRKP
jgi:metal-responsive CopG/Arc/MetJ family transcriptional regulator